MNPARRKKLYRAALASEKQEAPAPVVAETVVEAVVEVAPVVEVVETVESTPVVEETAPVAEEKPASPNLRKSKKTVEPAVE